MIRGLVDFTCQFHGNSPARKWATTVQHEKAFKALLPVAAD
jgi:hypothetical protein